VRPWEKVAGRRGPGMGTFYEIYTPGNQPRPVRTWAYESERDFLWGAGTYLWALQELREAEGGQAPSR